ncbi:MAG: T9SS type A sorting domain-containing protein [Bacteroidales bacterium]|nr:T9SS type A sorting domain-containing protein [Bacteroidales bacterium]
MRIRLIVIFVFSFVFLKIQGQTAPEIGSVTQPTCSVPTGSVVLNGLPAGEWTLTRSPDNEVTSGSGPTITVTNLPAGVSYTFTVSTDEGTSPASSPVIIDPQPTPPPTPVAIVTAQPTCTVATGTIVVSSPLGSEFEYNIDNGSYQPSATFAGILPGDHDIRVRSTSDNTCISNPATVTINSRPETPAAPTVGTITNPTCAEPTGSIVLNGLPSTGTWTLNRTPGGSIQGTGTTTTVTGLAPNTYSFTVTNEAGCTSAASGNIVINPQPSVPDAATVSVTHPTCAVGTGSITITAPLGNYQYNIDNGTFQSSALFQGISPGQHTILVRRSADNTCISSPVIVTINAQPSVPPAPVFNITQPSCTNPAGTIVVTSPLGNYQYNIDGGPYQASVTFSGIGSGDHYVRVRSSIDNTCVSVPALARIDPQPVIPGAPVQGSVIQPTCTVATGSISLNGLPSTGTWTLTRTPGGTVVTGTGTSITIGGLPPNTYSFTVTNEYGCISPPLTNVVINSQPVTPAAPVAGSITHPSCLISTGSVVLNGLPSSGTWTLTRTPGGTTYTGSGTTTTITGLPANTYTFTVTNADGCTSASTNNIVINSPPPVPAAPSVGAITQPSCAVSTGSVVITGLPSTGTWVLTRTPGGNTYTGTGTSITISGLAANTYTFTVTNSSGCTSAPSGNVVINVRPATPQSPSVGSVTQPDCARATGSVVLNNLPSEGTWILSRTPDGATMSGTGTTTTVSGLAANTYTFSVTNAAGCVSNPSANVIITTQPETPLPPVTGAITQPDCNTSTGSLVVSGLPSAGIWTLTRNPGGVSTSSSGTSITLHGIPPGNYTYVVSNAAGCTSAPSASVIINASPVTPAAPAAETIVQPGCSTETGSVTLNGLPSAGTWTLVRNPGNISTTGTGSRTTITGLLPNTYTFTVTNESGCTSPVSANVIINPQPLTPVPPNIGSVTHPSCTNAMGSIVLNGLPASGVWTITRAPGEIRYSGTGATTTIHDLPSNTYRFTVTNESGCTSAPSGNVTINPQPPTPAAPVIGNINHPTCNNATGTVALDGLPESGTWTLTVSPGGTTYSGTGNSFSVAGLSSGRYTFTVTNSYGCISSSSSNAVINSQPPTPSAPTVVSITQPVESRPTGSAVLGGLPASGTWVLTRSPGGNTITGTGTRSAISGLPAGIYTFTVTNSYGCTSSPSPAVGIYTLKATGPGDKILRHNDTIRIGNSEAGSLSIRIESNAEWTVSENSMWMKAVKEPGTSVIKVTYLDNISVFEKIGALKIHYSLNPEMVLFISQKGRVSRLKESKLEAVSIYPNPASTLLNVDLPGEKFDRIVIAITNKLGNTVFIKNYFRFDPGNKIELNISGFPDGQYFVTISDGEDHKTLTLIKH